MPCHAGVPPLLVADAFAVRRADGFTIALPELRLEAGAAVVLLGPPGSGKSTVLRGLLGLLEDAAAASQGQVAWCGEPRAALAGASWQRILRTEVVLLPQDAAAAFDPLQRIDRQLYELTGAGPTAVLAVLQALGIALPEALLRRWPHQISGGEAQRLLFALARLRRPRLVVADEPTAHLDAGSRARVVAELQALRAAGAALLLATHDRQLPGELGALVLVAGHGCFAAGQPPAVAPPAPPPPLVMAGPPQLEARGLEVQFGARQVLAGLDLCLWPREVLAVTGPSGVGKSTLLAVLAGRRAAERGTVRRPEPAHYVQLCGQDAWAGLTPGRTLGSLLDEVGADAALVARLLAALRLPHALLQRTAQRMSGGERRAAGLLRALAVAPRVLLLDEPTAGLDAAAASGLFTELLALQRELGFALGFATHDTELAAAVAHRVLTLCGGRWAA